MVFTLRFLLGAVLVLSCAIKTAQSDEDEKNEQVKAQNVTSIVGNLTDKSELEPKTDVSTESNKTLDSSEASRAEKKEEVGRLLDIEKYLSQDFHNKNNVYTLPTSPDTQKYIHPDFDFHATTHKHDHSEEFNFEAELTTPKSLIFDHKYKEAVESVDQKLEHIDDSHELSAESESKENINVEKLYEQTQKNDTESDLNYVNYKSIIANDTGGKNSLHKDVVVESGSNLAFLSSYNQTTTIDENDSGNNTIVKEPESEEKVDTSTISNVIPAKGESEKTESSTVKTPPLTTRKSIVFTKPPSTKNSSHISILSNNIETETVKAVNPTPTTTTEKPKGEKEGVVEVYTKPAPIDITKRGSVKFSHTITTTFSPNRITKKPEQLLQENQIIPVRVEPPPNQTKTLKTTEATVSLITTVRATTEAKFATTESMALLTTLPNELESTGTEYSSVQSQSSSNSNMRPETTTTLNPTTTSTKVEVTTTVAPKLESTIAIPKVETRATSASTLETIARKLETIATTLGKLEATTTMAPKLYTTTATTISPKLTITTTPKLVATTSDLETTTLSYTTTDSTSSTPTEQEETTIMSTFLSDSTVTSTPLDVTTTQEALSTYSSTATEEASTTPVVSASNNTTMTTESVRTSKKMTLKDTTTIAETTETVTTVTAEATVAETETVQAKVEQETTAFVFPISRSVVPEFKSAENDTTAETETTENNTITSDSYELTTNGPEDNSGTIAAITISSIGAACLVLLVGLLVIMRKRQKRFNYGQRCRPVNLDDYSMDNVSVYNSVRRKGMMRGSKRSYGNPAFEDPTSLSHPLNFPALGKFANNAEDMRAEFEEIPQITARTNELPEGCDTKNRYANVIPLPETRVFLNVIDGYPNSDYINANYVTGPKNTKGYYIACQAPMSNTVDDFWRMVWEQETKVVLMLTHLFENGVEKCVDYLPPSEVLDCHRLFGDFQVTLKRREVKDKYIISILQLKNMVSNSWREVTHFWYLGWPEKGVPSEANSLIAFLIEARSYMKSSSLDRKEVTNGNLSNGATKNELNPVVVHCSPGTGRTGVVIACDIAIREFEQTRLVDIPRIVYKIRRDRASAVQTKEQYAFIYKVVNLYATKLTGGAFDSL